MEWFYGMVLWNGSMEWFYGMVLEMIRSELLPGTCLQELIEDVLCTLHFMVSIACFSTTS